MKKLTGVLVLVLLCGACGNSSPTAPSTSTPAPTPTPTAPTLTAVTLAGAFGSLTTPNASTQVTATGMMSDGTQRNMTSSCTGWASDNTFVATVSGSGLVTAHNSGSSTITSTCQGQFARVLAQVSLITPFFQSGVGDYVFTLPSYVTKVKITGDYSGYCQNFAVDIAKRLIVNEILGACSVGSGRHFEGTYATQGGLVEITISTGVNWTFTEIR